MSSVQMSLKSCPGFFNELLPMEGTKKCQSEGRCLLIPHHATRNCMTYFPTKLLKNLTNSLSVILPIWKKSIHDDFSLIFNRSRYEKSHHDGIFYFVPSTNIFSSQKELKVEVPSRPRFFALVKDAL